MSENRSAETIEILFWNKSYSCESKLPLHRIVLEVIFNIRTFSDEIFQYTYRIFFLDILCTRFSACAEIAKASGLVQDLCTSICTTTSEVVTVPSNSSTVVTYLRVKTREIKPGLFFEFV